MVGSAGLGAAIAPVACRRGIGAATDAACRAPSILIGIGRVYTICGAVRVMAATCLKLDAILEIDETNFSAGGFVESISKWTNQKTGMCGLGCLNDHYFIKTIDQKRSIKNDRSKTID